MSKSSFSQSKIWKLQEQAYKQFGPVAWASKGVPFYLTSNPLIAKQFAEKIKAFSEEPLIFDLGAGSGRLAYLILKELEGCNIRYVMTDMVDSNIEFWKKHPHFQKYIENGTLEFTRYHHDQKEPIIEKIDRPVVLICTYFFDTIPQDLYKVESGNLLQGSIVLENETSIENLAWHYEYEPATTGYKNPLWNQLLEEYRQTFEGSVFLFPTGALEVIDYFAALSKGRLLILAGDQGVATEDQVRNWGEPKISKHASFSVAVSYHTIKRYFELLGGGAILPKNPNPKFITMCGYLGKKIECNDEIQPIEYLEMTDLTEEQLKRLSLDEIFQLIELGNYDPINFHVFYPIIREKIHTLPVETIKTFVRKVYDQFYWVSPEEGDFVLNLGVLLYDIKEYKEALFYFHKALQIKGPSPLIFYNITEGYKALKLEGGA